MGQMDENSDIGPYALVPLHVPDRVSDAAAVTYMQIAGRYANRETGIAFPSVATLGKVMHKSERTVRRLIKELEDAGALRKKPRYRSDGGQSSNEYKVIFARPMDSYDTGGADPPRTNDTPALRTGDTHNQKKNEPEKKLTKKFQSVNANGVAKAQRRSDPKDNTPAAAVFDHWLLAMQPQRRPKLTRDRRRKIEARLNEGYGVTDLKQAIDGCAASDFHMGRDHNNDLRNGGRKYNSIDLIFRNAEHVDRFVEMAPSLLRPTAQSILETRSVMTDDEIAEAVAANEFPFDEASNETLARQGVEAA